MRFTAILVPGDEGWVSAMVPAMPGCVSQGRTREEALDNVREAMEGWVEVEAARGGIPLQETPALLLDGVSTAIQIIDEMRAVGELNAASGYNLELATVELPQPITA
jgi:predicted RNase H-like HicB family nuclease